MYISIVNRLKKFIEFVKKNKNKLKARKCDWQYVTAIKTSFR